MAKIQTVKNNKIHGFTLIEMMITVAIVAVVAGLSVTTLMGDRARSRTVATVNATLETLTRAQAEASSNNAVRAVCFKNDSGGVYMQIYQPAVDANNVPTDDDCVDGEKLGYRYYFRKDVNLCTNCDSNIDINKSIFFDSTGYPTIRTGVKTAFEICVYNSQIEVGSRAREVEITKGGIIEKTPLGKAGNFSTVKANTGNCS